MRNTVHNLKTINPYFEEILEGRKNFELRKDDRDFQLGDEVYLKEYNPLTKPEYTGRQIIVEITYILREFDGLDVGYLIFGFKQLIEK